SLPLPDKDPPPTKPIAPGCVDAPDYPALQSASSTGNRAVDAETILPAAGALPLALSPCTADCVASWSRSLPDRAVCRAPSISAIDCAPPAQTACLPRAEHRDSLPRSPPPLPVA